MKIKLKPMSSMTKADFKAVEDKIYETFRIRTKAFESPTEEYGGYKSNIRDVNPDTRVTWTEVREYITEHGFEPDVTASEMKKFGKFTSKALKRFNIEKKKEGKPVTEHSIDMRKNLQDEN